MNLLWAMAAICVTWLLIASAFTGLGLGLARLLWLRTDAACFVFPCFWLGFAITLLGLQIWHFAFAVNLVPILVVLLVGLTSFWIHRTEVISFLRAAPGNWAVVLAGLMVLWIANRCTGPAMAFDTGYYDYPVVKWSTAYPIVPGLGNLHDRLGFNNSSLLYTAMLDQSFWRTRSAHLANGLLLAALSVQIIFSISRLLNSRSEIPEAELFDVVLLMPVAYIATDDFHFNISSMTTDVSVTIVLFVSASLLFRQLARAGGESETGAFEQFVLATLLAAALTIKLSSVVFVAGCGLLLIWLWRGELRAPSSQTHRVALISGISSALLIIPWLVRGYILTGYPAYPNSFGSAAFEWKVPRLACLVEQRTIVSLGQFYYDFLIAGTPSEKGPWFHAWLVSLPQHAKNTIILPILFTCLGFGLAWISWLKFKSRPTREWLLTLPCLASIVFWLREAPAPRFGFFAFWILAVTAISASARPFIATARGRKRVIVILCLLCVGLIGTRFLYQLRKGIKFEAMFTFVTIPGPDHGFYPFPDVPLTSFTTTSGLRLYVPIEDGRVYDAPLLTTPWPERSLELRRAGDPSRGFRLAVKENIPQGAETRSVNMK